jgi:hypothetical protein
MKHNLKLKESKTRKKERFKDLESFKRKLPIDRLKSMLSEPKELLKKVRDKQEKEKDSNTKKDKEFKLI